MKRLLLALVLALSSLPAFAFDASDKAGVEAAIRSFDQAFKAGNYNKVIGYMPPKIMGLIAAQAGMPAEQLEPLIVAQTKAAMANVTVNSNLMDVANMTAGRTSTGLDYAFVPTTTKMTPNGGAPTTSKTQTLALEDNGTWYLIRIDGAQHMKMVRAAYPSFKTIQPPKH
ncbi:MAG: hypothetical protein ACRBCL_00385 [Maritimibacter sp.]